MIPKFRGKSTADEKYRMKIVGNIWDGGDLIDN